MLTFAMWSLGILLVRRRHADHAASFVVAGQISCQDTQHALGVEAVGFGATSPAIDENAGRFEHIAFYVMPDQKPSLPASKQQMILTDRRVFAAKRICREESSFSKAGASPPAILNRCGFLA